MYSYSAQQPKIVGCGTLLYGTVMLAGYDSSLKSEHPISSSATTPIHRKHAAVMLLESV